jgi:DMSO/TMAO reductase YedYZ molybdopterin-dependent catalytic subunit
MGVRNACYCENTGLQTCKKLFETAFLAYEWEGEPLPILHGFPVRVALPGVSGGYWVKRNKVAAPRILAENNVK